MTNLSNSIGQNFCNDLVQGRDEANGPEVLNSVSSTFLEDEGNDGRIKAMSDFAFGVELPKKIKDVPLNNVPILMEEGHGEAI